MPTLLHFSARYGLKNLTALLLTCPGALQAYSVANKYGHYPNTIAEKHGFKDLRQFIDEYVVRRSNSPSALSHSRCGQWHQAWHLVLWEQERRGNKGCSVVWQGVEDRHPVILKAFRLKGWVHLWSWGSSWGFCTEQIKWKQRPPCWVSLSSIHPTKFLQGCGWCLVYFNL